MENEFLIDSDVIASEDIVNVGLFQVFNKQHQNVSNRVIYVIFFLSKNAMLGLGTELIRLAHNFEEGKEVHVIPASKETGAQQSMGIFLTPDSCEFIIRCEHFEPIETILEKYKKKHA